jgi:diguanylate cyclase (GGDEF)-like protein
MSMSGIRWPRVQRLRRPDSLQAAVPFAFAALGVLLVAYLLALLVAPAQAGSTLIGGWGVDAFELAASGLCLASCARRRSGRAVPLILGVALTSWSFGDLALTIESLGGATPAVPSVADGFYLVFFPLAYVALVLFVRGQGLRLTTPNWLDGAVAGLGAAALCAAFAFSAIQHSVGESALTVAVNLAYPVGDVLLLLVVVAGTAMLGGRNKAPWLLMAFGITANVLGDTSNLLQGAAGSSHLGSVLNAIAWPTSILLLSMAMWLPRGSTSPLAIARPPGFALPGLAAAVGLVILFLGTLGHVNHIATALSAATLLLVVVRTRLSVGNLRALSRDGQRLAVTDHLTGLGNRRHLFEVLGAFFADREEGHRLAFLFIDLDGFKQVNDSFGHPAGDEILKRVSTRLADSLRPSDLLARVGGDEFCALLIDAGAEEAEATARHVSDCLAEPFTIDAVSAKIGASIGAALAPTDATDGAALMWCADVAMYRAKRAATRFALYERDFDDAGNRLRLADELRSAIRGEQLVLHYQPQLKLRPREVVAVEALVRWEHPTLGMIAPLKFLPLAEEAGLMGALTRWVLENALAQCGSWRASGHRLRVSVNVSAGDLLGPGFIELVSDLLRKRGLPSDALLLEITETTVIEEFERCRDVVAGLRARGVEVSIDDFGAGFTSLAYLAGLAVSELKLDRRFITPLAGEHDARDVELVRATIELGHALRLRVVAEGVEDPSSLELLAELGCDLAQGYEIGRPTTPSRLRLAMPDSAAHSRLPPGGTTHSLRANATAVS